MATKASNIDVKNGGRASISKRTPVASTYAPLTGLRGDLDRVINRFFPEGWPHMNVGSLMDFEPMRTMGRTSLGGMMESARADVSETDSEYEISVELPGIDETDIELGISGGVLTLKAEKKEQHEWAPFHATSPAKPSNAGCVSSIVGVNPRIPATARGMSSVTFPSNV